MPPQQQQRDDPAPWETGQQQQPPSQDSAPWETGQPSPDTIGGYPRLPQADVTTPHGAGEFGIGALKSVGQTIHGGAAISHLVPQRQLDLLQQLVTPTTPEQEIGKETGQALQFLAIPGGEGLAGAAMRVGGSGALSAMQAPQPSWGEFAKGAGSALVPEAIGAGMRTMAPGTFRGALGIPKIEHAYGKTPEATGLAETTGFRPSKIAQSADQQINQLESNINSMAQGHPSRIDLRPAIAEINDDIARYKLQNRDTSQLVDLRNFLTVDKDSGLSLAPTQRASKALALKRGMRKDYITNYNPAVMHDTRATAAEASHAIDNQLDQALGPEFTDANQRISSLIPVRQAAEAKSMGAGITQNIQHRIAAHTGALIPAFGGELMAGRGGGIPGLGFVKGLVLPEVLSAAPMRVGAARAMYGLTRPGSIPNYVIPRLITGAISQETR